MFHFFKNVGLKLNYIILNFHKSSDYSFFSRKISYYFPTGLCFAFFLSPKPVELFLISTIIFCTWKSHFEYESFISEILIEFCFSATRNSYIYYISTHTPKPHTHPPPPHPTYTTTPTPHAHTPHTHITRTHSTTPIPPHTNTFWNNSVAKETRAYFEESFKSLTL